MLGLSREPCPAAVEAILATMMDDATSPGTRVYGMSGVRLWKVPMPAYGDTAKSQQAESETTDSL